MDHYIFDFELKIIVTVSILALIGSGLTNAAAEINFEEVTDSAGISTIGKSWGSAWGDFNNDNFPDLWLGNHGRVPSLYVNNGNGTFSNIATDPSLSKYDYIYELMTIYDKKKLNKKYPEVQTKSDLSNIYVWAAKWGVPVYDNLEKHLPIYDLMVVYSEKLELQNSYPEAANGYNLSKLFCWAKNQGVEEFSKLTPHAQFYAERCLKSIWIIFDNLPLS